MLTEQNEHADDLGQLLLALAGASLKIMIHFWRGWTCRCADMLGTSGQYALDELRFGWECFQRHKDGADPGVQAIIARSVFHLVAVIQLVRVAIKHKWKLTVECLACLVEAKKKNISSLINEDGFNRRKGKVARQKARKGTEQRAMEVLIEEGVSTQVHRYNEVVAQPSQSCRVARLPTHAFRPQMNNTSMPDMKDIIGRTEHDKAKWYSPGVDKLCVEHADLALLRYLDHNNKTRFAGQAWLGCLLKAKHKLIVGYKTDSNCFFALDDCTGSSTLVWPSKCGVVNTQRLWTECEVPPHVPGFEKRLCFAAVDCDDIMAFTYQWQSPLQLAFDTPPSHWSSSSAMRWLQCLG